MLLKYHYFDIKPTVFLTPSVCVQETWIFTELHKITLFLIVEVIYTDKDHLFLRSRLKANFIQLIGKTLAICDEFCI